MKITNENYKGISLEEFSYYKPEVKKCLSNHFKTFGFYPKYIRLYRISGIPCDLSVKHIKGFLNG